jgi:hypothetical protein
MFRDITTTADNRSTSRRVGSTTISTAIRGGFRGPELEARKANGVYRIVVGDSITEGQGISESDRPGHEVLNLGRAGADTPDHVKPLVPQGSRGAGEVHRHL